MTAGELATRLGGTPSGDGFMAKCPGHEDGTASLSINTGTDGKVLVHCHANCSLEAILRPLGLAPRDLFNGNGRAPAGKLSEPVTTYDYLDETGTLLYQVCRYFPKTFRQRRPDGRGGWLWKLDGTRRVLYRLPALLARPSAALVWVVEGEKDVDALAALGLVSTTNAGGAGKWRTEYGKCLAGADVVILPDNDEPGRAHGDDVARQLHGVAARIRLLTLPHGKDAAEFLATGGTLADLERLAATAPDWAPARAPATDPAPVPVTLEAVVAAFGRWLHLPDMVPVYAVLGAYAANQLEGDPVWLGIVAPPSSAKTEILNALSRLPRCFPVATVTPAGLLSGTAKKEHAKHAKGGLLREIGDRGTIILKDLGSVLSMRPDAKAETLAALREVYDGAWTRILGTEGGLTLTWQGKAGLIFGVTPALDSHHSVMGAMGERFVLCRLDAAGEVQARTALRHLGSDSATMRRELADAVAGLFAGERRAPRPLSDAEREELVQLATLTVRIRSTVERDRHSRDIELVHGAEGPARLVLILERLLAGLDSLDADRTLAFDVVRRVAADSVPVLRKRALLWLASQTTRGATTDVAKALGLPTNTVRRVLEDLACYDLVTRESQGKGQSDTWAASEWARARLPQPERTRNIARDDESERATAYEYSDNTLRDIAGTPPDSSATSVPRPPSREAATPSVVTEAPLAANGVPVCKLHGIPQRQRYDGLWRCPTCVPDSRWKHVATPARDTAGPEAEKDPWDE